MRFLTSWRKQPSISYCRRVIRNTIIHYAQMQQPCDLTTILEERLFVDASSEDEYMNQETLTQRLQTQLDKLQGTKYSQQVASSIDNNNYGLLNRNMSHPSLLQEAAFLPNEFPSFGAFADMNMLPNYYVYDGASNLNTSFQSTNSPFQQQHANDVEMDPIQYGDCLGTNQKNESLAFFTTMGNSQQSESLNLLMPQNVSGRISDVPNLFPNMNSNWQSSSVGNLWQDHPLKFDFLSDFEHLQNPYDHCFNASMVETGSCFVDQGANCYPMLGPLKQTHLPTKNHYGEKQLLCVNNNLKSNKRDTYDSSGEFEGMLPSSKRLKTDPAFDVSSINNFTYNLPTPEMVQPCTLEGISVLNKLPQSPLGEVLQLYMEQCSHPTQDSTKNHYGEKQLLCVNSNLKSNKRDTYDSSSEFEGMLPSTKRLKTDPAFGVSSINNFTYNLPTPEMVQPCTLEGISVLNKLPQSPLGEVLQLYMEQCSLPTQHSTSVSEVKNRMIDETFRDTFKSETVMAESIGAGQISEKPQSPIDEVIELHMEQCSHPTQHSTSVSEVKNRMIDEAFIRDTLKSEIVMAESIGAGQISEKPQSPIDGVIELHMEQCSHPTQHSTSVSEVKNRMIDEAFIRDTLKSEIVMAESIGAGQISEKPQSPIDGVIELHMEQCSHPTQHSTSVSEVKNRMIDEAFIRDTLKSEIVMAESIGAGQISEKPQSPIDEVIELHMERCSHPTQHSTSVSEVKNRMIDETFRDTSKSEIVMAESIDAGKISEKSHPKSHHVTASNKSKENVKRLNSSTHTLCNDPSSVSDIVDVKGKTESKNEIFLCEGHKGTHAWEEPHSKSHQVITISNNSCAHTPCNDRGDIPKIRTEFIQAGKNVTNEVEEQEDEPEKETNSSNSTVYGVSLTDFLTCDQIREHIMSFGQHFGQEEISDNTCQLCGMDELSFATLPIHCLSCGVRIKKNANYYYCKRAEEFDIDNCFCPTCYRKSGHQPITFKGTSISKAFFDRKTNHEMNEPWVQCDKCKRWQHQICGLYNTTTDMEGNSEYTCPICCLNEIENGMPEPLPKTNIFGAKDLPRTMLSEHIEQRLLERLKQERADMAKIEGKNLDEVLVAENLCVRVLSSSNKQLKVDKQFLDIFSKGNDPTEFNYESKAIFLFQKIEGVDVCLFSMYVQEFGSDCRHPNQRCVYISYLDSVKYLRPQRQTATGEALRTFIYHEILIGYLDYCKKRGFATCYIWACPPRKGDDYILYCHPITQKTPKNDQLRHWYHSMLRKASKEKIVVGLTNMYDQFFDTTGKCDPKVTASRLPYFDGDYWHGAAMNIVKKIQETRGNDVRNVKKGVRKRIFLEHTNPPKGSRDVLVMQELGKKILPYKEDFIIVQLQYACINCHEVIMSGKRWFCSKCKIFQECERCHTADTHISSSGEKHTLCQVLVNDIPLHTKENDIILDNGLFETRGKFLSFCQRNHFQFDTLRRAKHSSIMILHHLKNILC